LFPALLIGLWALAVRCQWVAEQILPSPLVVLDAAVDLTRSGQLEHELGVSFLRLLCGLAIGGGLGLGCGVLMGASAKADAYLGPTIRAICLVPSLGWLPFFMIAFGIGETLKFVLIAKTCFLPLMINSYDAVRSQPRKYRDIARVLELGRRDTLVYVLVPSILPAIFTGFRLALSKGWKALILVEMIASSAGIGYLMTWGRKAFQLDVVLVTMLVIGVVGWIIDRGSLALERRFTRWSDQVSG
jgi:sulfonate transport system permease protein